MGVKLVIRLNKSSYSPQIYERNGIRHLDLIFPDGSSPSEVLLNINLNYLTQIII